MLQNCFCSVQKESQCSRHWSQTGLLWHWMWLWLSQINCLSQQPLGWLGLSCLPGSPPISTPRRGKIIQQTALLGMFIIKLRFEWARRISLENNKEITLSSYLQWFVLILLHGCDALMLCVNTCSYACFHHCVISCWRLMNRREQCQILTCW